MTYSELKNWFTENIDDLPKTLDGNYKFYNDVRGTAELYIHLIDEEVNKYGKDVKKSKTAKTTKDHLHMMYDSLQDKSNWDVERKCIGTFHNWMKK